MNAMTPELPPFVDELEICTAAPPPSLKNVTKEDLADNSRLAELYRQAVRARIVGTGQEAVRNFFAYAERATERDRRGTPGAMFMHMVKGDKLGYLTNAVDDRVSKRVNANDLFRIAHSAKCPPIPLAPSKSRPQQSITNDNVGYLQSILVQCGLPQKPITSLQYKAENGDAVLLVRAGVVAHPPWAIVSGTIRCLGYI